MESNDLRSVLKSVFLGILATPVFFLIVSYLLSMILGLASLFFTQEGLSVAATPIETLPIWLFYLPLRIPVNQDLGTLFLFLWTIYAICFGAAWRFRNSLHGVLKGALSSPTKRLFGNSLFAMPIVTSMTLVAIMAIQTLQESTGIPTGAPILPLNPLKTLFALSHSPIVEEIGFRVFPIGTFLAAYLFTIRRRLEQPFSWGQHLRLFILALLLPDRAKRLAGAKSVDEFGVREGIGLGEWVMILLSAAVFGLAHYVYGGGWEIGKITSAAAVGVALALTYVLYGVQAPILLHWFFNYYFAAFEVSFTLHPVVYPVYTVARAVIVILGIFGWMAIPILALQRAFYTAEEKDKPTEVESLTWPMT
jgi:hypothetical protein